MSRALEGIWSPHSAGLRWSEPEFETRSAGSALAHRDAGTMCPDDLHDDGQSKPCAFGSHPLATPEAIEDARSVLDWYARSTV